MRDAFCRGVGAVRGAESVVDVKIAKGGELARETRVVCFFFGVEAEVLQQYHVAGLHLRYRILRLRADAVLQERHLAV